MHIQYLAISVFQCTACIMSPTHNLYSTGLQMGLICLKERLVILSDSKQKVGYPGHSPLHERGLVTNCCTTIKCLVCSGNSKLVGIFGAAMDGCDPSISDLGTQIRFCTKN